MNKLATLPLSEVGCHELSLARGGFVDLELRGEFHNLNCTVA